MGNTIWKKHKLLMIAMAVSIVLIFMMEPLYGNVGDASGLHQINSQPTNGSVGNVSPYASSSSTPWTYPTNTTQEPGYTGGTYTLAQIGNPDYFNIYNAATVCDFYVLDGIYNSATTEQVNGTITPCLATNWTESTAPHGMTTLNPLTGATSPVKYIWTVHIRPGVQWQDWTSSGAASTYIYGNTTSFNNDNGVHFTHTYKTVYNATTGKNQPFTPIAMKTYYVQSADFVLSWKILQSSADLSGSYVNVVNVLPVNNLTVDYYLSGPSATFVPYTLETDIIPYHMWVSHDYASSGSGLWNETTNSALSASNAYNEWNMGQTGAFGLGNGEYPGLVGTGPFMMSGGYGMPMGKYFHDDYWQVYENPYYFMQYVTGKYAWLHSEIPKIYSEKVYIFSNPSAAVGALSTGKVDAVESNLPSEFLGTVQGISGVSVYEKPSTGYAYFKFNSYSADAPFNIATFRQALREDSPLSYIDSSICDGFDTPGYSILPTIDTPYSYSEYVPQYSFNPAKANATIASIPGMTFKGGEWYYDGVQVTATIQSPSSSLIPQIFTGYEKIASDWTKLGIATSVLSESFATIISKFDAYSNTASSPSASYNVITLGVSGLFGDPVGDLIDDFNYTVALGTGDYEGPFSTMNVTTPFNAELGIPDTVMNGTQIGSLLTNLSTFANTNSSLTKVGYAIDVMQYLEDEESTMMIIGYGPKDILAYSNTTFTGISHVLSDMNGYWYWNLFTVHLRSHAVIVPPSTAHIDVSAVPNKLLYYNGEYGNITFLATNNVTGKPVPNSKITVLPVPSLLNITSYSGITDANGEYIYEFKVSSTNYFFNTPSYSGEVNVSATVASSVPGVASGSGYTLINDMPLPVSYKVDGPSSLVSGSGYQHYNITIFNPLTGSPVSGYSYIIQSLNAAVNMKNTSSNQKVTTLSTYDAACNFTSMSVPVSTVQSDPNVTSISGVTGSNGLISVEVEVNSTFNFTLNGNDFSTYIFMGDYALAAPMYGEEPYMTLGEMTSSSNPNGFGTGEPFEIPIEIEKSPNTYAISIKSVNTSATTTEMIFTVTDGGKAVSSYTLNVSSQNVLGANRGYFIGSTSSIVNPNYYLVETAGAETGSHYEPAITLTTDSSGVAYANFSSLFYTVNSTGVVSPEPVTSSVLPFDVFQISVLGDGAVASANYVIVSNGTTVKTITFNEHGVKSGVSWSVSLNGHIETALSGSPIVFGVVSQSSNSYVTEPILYYTIVTNASGTVEIQNSSKMVNVTYVYVGHNVTFMETGLASGTTWSVTLNGVTLNSTSSTVTFIEVNGTYKFSVANVTGYNITKNATGSVTVDGANVTVNIVFQKVVTPTVTPPPKVSYTDYYIIIGVVVAIAVIAGVVVYITKRGKTNK